MLTEKESMKSSQLPEILIQQNKSASRLQSKDSVVVSRQSRPKPRRYMQFEHEFEPGPSPGQRAVGQTGQRISELLNSNISNNRSVDHIRDPDPFPLPKRHIGIDSGTHTENQSSLESRNNYRLGPSSYSSLERQRPDTQQMVASKGARAADILKTNLYQADGSGLRVLPLAGLREGFGVSPGTANTQGAPPRPSYKNPTLQVQYQLQSQQCHSELYQVNSIPNYYNNQNLVYQNYKVSNLDESFENLFCPDSRIEPLSAVDQKHDLQGSSEIPGIPIIRNQKSQATYRKNHQKINQIINQFHNHGYEENRSLSEMLDN